MNMEITPAKPEDLNQIKEILKENELPFSDLNDKYLTNFLVIRNGVQLIATIGAEIYQPYALLRSLAVLHTYRNKGLAARLVARLEAYLRSQKVQSIYLLTTTAEKYFIREGYTNTTRTKVPGLISETSEFKNLCPDTAVCMVKHFDPVRR